MPLNTVLQSAGLKHPKVSALVFKTLLFLSGAAFLAITTPWSKTGVMLHLAAMAVLLVAIIALPIKCKKPNKTQLYIIIGCLAVSAYICAKLSWRFYMACYYLCKALNCKQYGIITSAMLLMPFSRDYLSIVLKGAYYIPHICISFVGLGLTEQYVKAENAKKQRVLLLAASILALLAGMGGPRQVIVTYLPLALTGALLLLIEFFTEDKKIRPESTKYAAASIICLLSAGAGYIANMKLLHKIFHYSSWEGAGDASFDMNRLTTGELHPFR